MPLSQLPVIERRLVVVGDPTKNKSLLRRGMRFTLGGWIVDEALDAVEASAISKSQLVVLKNSADLGDDLVFPPGHPQKRVVYAAHPVRKNVYVVAGDYHDLVVREKAAELFTLLSALRVKELRIAASHESSRLVKLGLRALIPSDIPLDVGAKLGASNSSRTKLEVSATFDGKGPPAIPVGLAWLPHEPEWQSLANTRIGGRIQTFSVHLRHATEDGIDASLQATAESVGFSLGAKLKAFIAEEWHIEGTFASKPLFGW